MAAASTRRIIVAGAIGNVLEWYDFAVYGYFAAAIGRTFFPSEDQVAQVLAAFGIFAVGFLMRPIGGALIGHIGDRLGRRAALTFSVAAMAIPTFLVGVLPGYQTLGIAAPQQPMAPIRPRPPGLACSTMKTIEVVYSPPTDRPWIMRSSVSATGASTPSTSYPGSTPTRNVGTAIAATEKVSAVRRPSLSPIWPTTAPPTGRIR